MSHRRALLLMLLVTLLWSTAGVVTRHLQDARSFELTFWRSAFTLVFLSMVLGWQRGPALEYIWWSNSLRTMPRTLTRADDCQVVPASRVTNPGLGATLGPAAARRDRAAWRSHA